jgi:hypothetical protein
VRGLRRCERMRLVPSVLVVVVALLSGACGGSDGGAAEDAADETPRTLPACAEAGPAVALPEGMPADFPLPSGTVVTSADSPFEGQLVLVGAVPGDLQEAAAFFNDALPEEGYQVGIGDAEGTESEAPFTGNGFRGKWRVNGIPDCRAVRLTLVLIEQA